MWVRGLKLVVGLLYKRVQIVAPYVGAWIETFVEVVIVRDDVVAPYVGAWIETKCI